MLKPDGLVSDEDKYIHRIYVLGDLLRSWQNGNDEVRRDWAPVVAGVAWVCGMCIAVEQHACHLNKSGKQLVDEAYCGLMEAWGIDEEVGTLQAALDKIGVVHD